MMTTEWVKIAAFGTGFEADAARATLEEAGIPVLIRGNQAGIFGGGFQGPVIGGVELHVPSSAASAARDLLATADEEDES